MINRALPMAISAASRDIRGMYRRARRNAVLNGIAAVCFVTAYVAGLIAVGAYLAPIYGPVVSALLVTGAMATLGVVILLALAILKRREKRRQARREAARRMTAAAALSLLPQLARSKSLLLVACGWRACLPPQPGTRR